jgi:uncharacterized protein (TIGR01777 family)
MAKRILIAGGTGLIGRAAAQHLARAGREIVLLTRSTGKPASAAAGLPDGCRLVHWDGRSPRGWGELASGAEAILNLAGESIAGGRWTGKRKERIRRSRIEATAAVVAAIAAAKEPPGVLVQASAVGFYGDRGAEPLDERAGAGSGFLADTAVAWEAASAPVEALGVRRVIVRSGMVLAREGGALPRMALPFRFGIGALLGPGTQWMPWIHLADEVAAIEFVIARGEARGAFNLCAPEEVTQAGFSRALAKTLRRPLFFRAPAFALRVLLGEMSELVLASQRVVPRNLRALGFSCRFPELRPTLADLLTPDGERS